MKESTANKIIDATEKWAGKYKGALAGRGESLYTASKRKIGEEALKSFSEEEQDLKSRRERILESLKKQTEVMEKDRKTLEEHGHF